MEMENRRLNVKNRGTGNVSYNLPELGIYRDYTAGEIKKGISFNELEKLTYIPGGKKLIEKYLLINDQDVVEELGLHVEPEYYYDEQAVRALLVSGTIEQLLDCLDFAPEGVLDLVKKISIEIKLNDIAKREAIKDKLKFDITAALTNIEFANSKEATGTAQTSNRRAEPVQSAPSTNDKNRRIDTSQAAPKKYNRA